MSTHSCSLILSKQSSFARLSVHRHFLWKKLTSINPNRLYFITLDKDIVWEEELKKQNLPESIGNWQN